MAIATMTAPLPISLFPFLLLNAAICFTICDANSNARCIQSEREGLLKFKNHLIDPSNRLSSWVEGGDCCEWIGVVCHNSTGQVHQLNLAPTLSEPDEFAPCFEWEAYERSKLGGKINPSLLELKHLSSLDLSYNNFSSIYILKFFGIPHNLGNLSKLHYLDLGGNYLKPKSFQWVSGLSSLQYLDLSGADLSKANDWLQVTFKHPSLLKLRLSNCCLEDDPSPISVNSTKSLVILDLSGNGFSSVPKSIFSLHSLMSFDLSENSLEGPIPYYFGNISFLEVLDLTLNHLNSSIPNSLYSLNRLLVPESWRNSRLLESLAEFRAFKFGKQQFDRENHFNGSVPEWIRDKHSRLKVLSLQSNHFDGHIPHRICDLQYLQNLDLAHDNISGTIPKCFSNLTAMANRSNQMLKGQEDEYSATLGLVTSMDLSTNSLTGEIPNEIGSLIELRSLNLSTNLLAGNIPNEIGNMELMESLDLSVNRLNGEIPPSISNLNFLNHFNVSYNNLTGQIPISTQLQSFENFSYMGNHLCGPPLTKSCNTKGIPTDVANNGSSSEGSKVNWLYVA
ncbi:hypothetical protein GOBAR_DD11225 [Gossypium barbadense]|nr:hypothetical protein GOBAR_DD11225 [Gossypium barbadense]